MFLCLQAFNALVKIADCSIMNWMRAAHKAAAKRKRESDDGERWGMPCHSVLVHPTCVCMPLCLLCACSAYPGA